MDVHILLIQIIIITALPTSLGHLLVSFPPKDNQEIFFSNLSGFQCVFNAAASALLLPNPACVLFRGPLEPPSGIIAPVDHADYSRYLSAVKALHLLPTPYKSISSKAFLCRSPGSFPSDDECGTFFIETGEAGISVQCAHFATAVQRWGKNK